MDLELLTERYFRLTQELSLAYRAAPWVSSRIDRIADEIAAAEREIAAVHSARHRAVDFPDGSSLRPAL